MDIGPISAIRPVPMVNPARVKPDLSRVSEADLRDGEQEETYSPSHSQASRGLEDEESDLIEPESAESSFDIPVDADAQGPGRPAVSFFA